MAGLQEANLATVIDRFYEAAVCPELWRTVLHEYGQAAGAEGAMLLSGPTSPLTSIYSEGLDEIVHVGLRDGWIANNPRVARGVPAMRGAQDVVTEARLFSPEDLDRLPWYADFGSRFGFKWFAGTYLVPNGPASILLSAERRTEQGLFSPSEVEIIGRMVPHFQRAGQLAMRLAEAHSQGMLDTFDLLNCGGMLIDFLGRTIRINGLAQRHIGRGLTLAQGQLLASRREANSDLQRLIGSVLQPGPAHEAPARGAVAVPRPEGRPLIVHAAPIVGSARDLFQSAKAVLMIVDPDEHREPAEPILRQAFGLTPAEARLAMALANGRDLKEIAQASGISEGTARTQLKAVFAKTHTHRQAEVVALLGRLFPAG